MVTRTSVYVTFIVTLRICFRTALGNQPLQPVTCVPDYSRKAFHDYKPKMQHTAHSTTDTGVLKSP